VRIKMNWIEDNVRENFGEVYDDIVEEVKEIEFRNMMKNSEGREKGKRREVLWGERFEMVKYKRV